MTRHKPSKSALLFDHFGVLAPFYEQFISPPDIRTLMTLLELRPEDRLLDAGGGTGRVAQHFKGMCRHICIMDLSVGMLVEAQAKGGLCTCRGKSERLAFADESFERVLAVDSFHHFRDQAVVAHELVRVLAPGGRLVIEEPNIAYFPVKLIALAEKLLLMRSHFYRPAAISRLFAETGATVTLYTAQPPNYWAVVEKT